MSLSLLLDTRLDAGSNFWDILPPLLVGGAGMGLAMTPTTAAAMGSVPMDKAGVGSAVLNSMRQVGGSLGIAILGAIIASYITLEPTNPARRHSSSRASRPRATWPLQSRSSA